MTFTESLTTLIPIAAPLTAETVPHLIVGKEMNENTRSPNNSMAIASLVFSILSLVLGPLGFIPGIVCGHIARNQNKRNAQLAGDGLALAGLIIGYVFLVFTILCIILFLALKAASPQI